MSGLEGLRTTPAEHFHEERSSDKHIPGLSLQILLRKPPKPTKCKRKVVNGLGIQTFYKSKLLEFSTHNSLPPEKFSCSSNI